MKITTMPGDKPGKNIEHLMTLDKARVLQFNEEYQRAPAWKLQQKQLFIDSVFRGYSIPAFYFHEKGSFVEDLGGKYYDVVDGQQRIRAIREFVHNDFALLSPEGFKKLPPFLTHRETEWAGCHYTDLSDDLKAKFRHQPLVIYVMTTDDDNEVRDLFIRLQGGTPLSDQDKRDTYPGELPKFVMEMGGKPPLNKDDVVRYRGHPFFNELIKGGTRNKRQLAAQLMLLLSQNAEGGEPLFHDINSRALDGFYLNSIGDFAESSDTAKRFKNIIGDIHGMLPSGKTPPLAVHEAIHLFLLVNTLLDGYAADWEGKLQKTFEQFRKQAEDGKKAKNGDYFMHYVRWTSQSSDRASTIKMRHAFFMEEMLRMLSPTALDATRSFPPADKKCIYLRDEHLCQWCRMRGEHSSVNWNNAEYHHIVPHSEGGKTEVSNGALMHPKCHPRSQAAVATFREWWESERGNYQASPSPDAKRTQRRISDLPEGTKCRFEHEGNEYNGVIVNGKLDMREQLGKVFNSFKAASEAIVREKPVKNWWLEWDIQLPGMQEDEWMPADNWQTGK